MTYCTGENEMKIDFALVGKGNRKYLRDVKVVTDLVKKVKNVVRKEAIERRKIWKLKEDDARARYEGRVGQLVSTDVLDLWKWFKEGVLKECDEVCGKKKGKRDQADTSHGGGTTM